MNTILTREQFTTFRTTFRRLAANKQLEPIDLMFYNIIRGLPSSRGFSPITNTNKLANGAAPNYSFESTRRRLTFLLTRKPLFIQGRYGVMFTEEIQTQLAEVLK